MKIKIQEPIKLLRRENMSELIQFPKLETSKNKLPNLMFREDVMKYFGISKSTLWRWTNVERKLKSFKVGRRKLFKVSDIENMVEECYS